jgi:iron-sulfur cluster repair protein YtfE (RIC family)
MKRDPRLQGLSSDHHRALVTARRLARGAAEGRGGADLAREAREAYARDLAPHFAVEEEVLLPALEEAGARALAERTRREHREMRADLEAADGTEALERVASFARRLEAHVRFEERDLFVAAERLPAGVLDRVGARAPHPRAERPPAGAGQPIAPGGAGLAGIGPPAAPADVVDLLVECHGRIRTFLGLARRIAEARGVADAEIAEAAAAVRRYFAEALPLHARDEEESVLPLLAGHDPGLDDALARMRAEHAEHGEPLARLLEACGTLSGEPGALERVRPALLAAAADLEAHFAVHLEAEERVVFPAIRAHLDPEARARIAQELRARRAPPVGGPPPGERR